MLTYNATRAVFSKFCKYVPSFVYFKTVNKLDLEKGNEK